MATASGTPMNIEKRSLKNAPMYINRIQGGDELRYHCIQWTITKFSKMKNVPHKSLIPELNWYFSISKGKESLKVELFTKDSDKKMKCYILYHLCERLRQHFPVVETVAGIYQSRIPLSSILVPENALLTLDITIVMFVYDIGKERDFSLRPFISTKCNYCSDRMKQDLCEITTETADFSIKVKRKKFSHPFNKAILAARSKYFYSYLKQTSEVSEFSLCTTRTALELAAYYMYTGGLKSLSLGEYIGLLKLTVPLKIPNLQSICIAAIKDFINLSNVDSIMEIGNENGLVSLVEAADNYLKAHKDQ